MVALIPASSANPRAQPDYHRLAVVDGRFARDKITAYALKNGLRENYNDQEILVLDDAAARDMPGQPSRQTRLAFLSRTRIAVADAAANDPDQGARARTLVIGAAEPLSDNGSLSPLAEHAKPIAGAPF